VLAPAIRAFEIEPRWLPPSVAQKPQAPTICMLRGAVD
jgi:hypothetical protein